VASVSTDGLASSFVTQMHFVSFLYLTVLARTSGMMSRGNGGSGPPVLTCDRLPLLRKMSPARLFESCSRCYFWHVKEKGYSLQLTLPLYLGCSANGETGGS
jgi:hypothetical protein